jgi:Fe(3+) dicitrate transport protein
MRTRFAAILLALSAIAAPALAQQAPAEPKAEDKPPPEPIDISVVGTKTKDTSGSAHTVSNKQLERFEHDDPHQVLRGVPGVYVRGEDGFGLRPNIGMRGAMSDRSKKITLMEDGVLFGPAPYSAPAAYYFPLITRMTSVRVIKGPSAITFGPHTVGGAIDFSTAPIPVDRAGMVDLAFGQYLYRKLHVRQGWSDEHFGILGELVHVANNGFKNLDGGGDTGFSRYELMVKGRYVFNPGSQYQQELELKGGYSGEVSNETYLGLSDADFRDTPYRRYAASKLDRMEWNRTQVALTHRGKFGKNLDLKTTFYRHDLHRVWRKANQFRGAAIADVLGNPTDPRNAVFYGVLTGAIAPSTDAETLMIGPNDRTFVSQGVQSVLSYRPKTGPLQHRIEWGVRLHNDSIRREHTQSGFRVQGTELAPDGRPIQTTARNDAASWALALHAVDAITWGPVTATGGVRVESIRGVSTDALTGEYDVTYQQVALPGGGVFVELPKAFGLFAGVYQGFSPIPPGQHTLVRPEKSVNYEAGARWSPRRARIEVVGFLNEYSNLTNICTFSTGCIQESLDSQADGGAARVAGLEVYGESEIEVREGLALPARLAYTFTDARFKSAFTSDDPILDR